MNQIPQKNKLFVPFLVAACIIIILFLILILRKPQVIIQSSGEVERLKDSISLLTKQIDEEKLYTNAYKRMADSLLHLPPKIKVIYDDKRKFVAKATINQLDSIIRTTAGF